MSRFRFPLVVAMLLPLPAGEAAAQAEMLVLTRGADTIAVERLRRAATRLEAELVDRMQKLRWSFAVTLGESGVLKLENVIRRADADPASPPLQSAVFALVGDSAIVDIVTGSSQRTQRLGTRAGAVPFINPSFALFELVVDRLQRSGRDSLTVPILAVSGGQTLEARLRRLGPDSVAIVVNAEARLAVSPDGRILGGTVPAQGLTLTRAPATSAALHVPKPDYTAPPGAPYTTEEVQVPTPMGHTLGGTLSVPTGRAGPLPAVVTITGSGLQDRDEEIPFVRGYRLFRQLADTLGRAGIAVLRMDDRGFGASGGDPSQATTEDFARDIAAGVAYLRARPEIDPGRIGLIGHSEGGVIAPLLAARDSGIRAIVVMAGPSRLGSRILEYQMRYGIEHSPAIPPAARDSALGAAMRSIDSLAAANPWWRFFLSYDPLPAARRVRAPALVLQGATDRQVTADQAEELGAAIREGGNRDVTVRVFAEANHLFVQDPDGSPAGYPALPDGRVRDDVVQALVEWLVLRLKAPF